jgi:hypothetical protein
MASILASANSNSLPDTNILILLYCGIVAGAGLLAIIPIAISRSRMLRSAEAIMTGAILWGIITAISLTVTALAEFQWSKERLIRLNSGYIGSDVDNDAPQRPWNFWAILAGIYCIIFLWSLISRSRQVEP